MKRAFLLLLGILAELGVFLVYANDPDSFDAAQLLDFGRLHHEFIEILLAAAAAAFYIAFWLANREGEERRPSSYAA